MGRGASSRSSWRSARSCRGRSRTSARSRRSPTRTRATARTASRCCARGSTRRRRSQRLTAADEGRETRQLGIVDGAGRGATFTGSECLEWAGGRTGDVLRRAGEHPRLGRRPSTRSPRRSSRRPARRSPSASSGASRRRSWQAATAAASSPRRCWSSSATAATRGLSDTVVDLRVDDHARPIEELERLYGIHQQLFGKTPRERVAGGRRRARGRSCSAGSAGSATTARRRRRSSRGRAPRISRNGSRAQNGSIRSFWRS